MIGVFLFALFAAAAVLFFLRFGCIEKEDDL